MKNWSRQLGTAIFATVLGLSAVTAVSAATYNQKGNALANYNVKKYKTVNNKNYYQGAYSYQSAPGYDRGGLYQTTPGTITRTAGTVKKLTFKTNLYLPVTYATSGDWGNPQSEVLSKNRNTLYTLVMLNKASQTGRVVKYDLATLRNKYHVSTTNMTALRRATYDKSVNQLTANDKAILNCMQVGPTFNAGHGQSLAMNPKNGELWFVGSANVKANVQRVSTKTLKPNKRINFTLKSTVAMGENLTFDKNGNAYFYTYSYGGWAPKDSLKIYKGKINKKSVKFHLIMQGLRHNPGWKSQSIAYNKKNNRLYFVSNSSISSVPVSKLGKLKAKDVKAVKLSGQREFEGLQFDQSGAGYLMVNKGAEILKTNGSF
ncbi:hypothetical protein [Lactiplantibacillus songbeiensis]|uniref:Extracellular protein n=1 Tax=Lactiplantibacillus songbeiensis TaxID=2559920 RepID=A0ABW4BY96_9LACO|nr:hypothetical protein [Lactiplantibacillus songbeiensis]